MSMFLLYVSDFLIVLPFILYFIMILVNNKIVYKVNGFDASKDALALYDRINIIETKSIFTIYNIKRKVVKLSSKNYYGCCNSDISVSLMEASISAVDDKNKSIDIFRRVVSSLKYLYLLPIIALIINSITYNIGNARIGLIFIFLFSIISFMIIDIHENAYIWLSSNIKKIKSINKDKVLKFVNNIILFDNLILFSEFLMVIRFFLIILGII